MGHHGGLRPIGIECTWSGHQPACEASRSNQTRCTLRDLVDREALRATFYEACAALVRAFANIAVDLDMAGYSAPEAREITRSSPTT